MTPAELRRAAEWLEAYAGLAHHIERADLARKLRAEADAVGCRMLKPSDAYCPGCGHNRDKSSVSSIQCADGMRQCQMCGAKWNELPLPPGPEA